MKTMADLRKLKPQRNEPQPNGKWENGKLDTNKLSKMQHWETCSEVVNITLRNMADRAAEV